MSILLKKLTKFVVQDRSVHTCVALGAARKGTRMKRMAIKKANKKEEIKKVFIPYAKRLEMEKVGTISPRKDDSDRVPAIDDVYFSGMHRLKNYPFTETVEMHRETAQPCQFNKLDGPILAHVELSLAADKKNKYMDGFSNILLLPFFYPFVHRRSIIILCQDEPMVEQMRLMNANLTLGPEYQRLIEKGELDIKMYDFIIAHTSLLPDLVPFRNLLKKKMPAVKDGTAGNVLEPLVKRFQEGVKYEVIKDKYDHDYAHVLLNLGPMIWETEKLEANLEAFLVDIEKQRLGKVRSADLITKVTIRSQHSREIFQIDFKKYFPQLNVDDDEEAPKVLEPNISTVDEVPKVLEQKSSTVE